MHTPDGSCRLPSDRMMHCCSLLLLPVQQCYTLVVSSLPIRLHDCTVAARHCCPLHPCCIVLAHYCRQADRVSDWYGTGEFPWYGMMCRHVVLEHPDGADLTESVSLVPGRSCASSKEMRVNKCCLELPTPRVQTEMCGMEALAYSNGLQA